MAGAILKIQPIDGAYHVWQVPGESLAVHLRRSVLDWIDEQVVSAFQSVPRRGAETGGILVGSKTFHGDRPVIIVESAEPIECEHRAGPSFLLSPRDLEGLAAQMRRLEAEGLVVVGYYRSHTRDETRASSLR